MRVPTSSNSGVTAVYSGTFDPITRGHEDIVQRASSLFPQVIVAVAAAHHKQTLFDLNARLTQVQAALAHLGNVRVLPLSGLLVDFMRVNNAQVVVRGLRSVTDFDYEAQMAGMNRHLFPGSDTVFLHASASVAHISSTLVREIHKLGGDVSGLVSPSVLTSLGSLRQAH